MLKYLLFSLITVSVLSGCASSGVNTAAVEPQYCFTDEKIEIENGSTVNSKKTIDCTDKPRVNHFVKATGMAKECRPYEKLVMIKGREANVKGFLCAFPTKDGNVNWEAVDARYSY